MALFHDNPFSVSNVYDFSLSAMYGHQDSSIWASNVYHDFDSSVSASNVYDFGSSVWASNIYDFDSSVPVSKVYHDFSLSAMYEYPNRISDLFFPPGCPSRDDLYKFMTNEDDLFSFEYMISESDTSELQRLASSLMSDSDYFLTIVGTKFGSKRMQKLLGKSDDVDARFCDTIVDRFIQIMTDEHASQVALRALAVFDKKKKTTLYEHVLLHALEIACDKHGCVALNDIITYADPEDEYYTDSILEFVADNVLILSDDDSGKYVVQHLLKLNDLRCTFMITFCLTGYFDDLHVSSPEGGTSASISPPIFSSYATAVRDKSLLKDLFTFMTNEEGLVLFDSVISDLDLTQLLRMVSLLTSESDYFSTIVTNKFGSERVQKFLGKSDDLDTLFCDAIKRSFLHIMTDRYASHVAVRAMVIFNNEKKTTMYEHILFNAIDIACDQHGCIALNDIITDMDDDKYYRHNVLEFVTHNALILSKHESGNCVVQHVIQLNYLQYTYNITNNLSGHFVELSFKEYGSLVVEKLVEADEKSMVVVCKELLKCKEETLIRLARDEFGNIVVCKALRLTRERFKSISRYQHRQHLDFLEFMS